MQVIEKMVSYREKVYQEIKQAIIAGKLTPGLLLNERKLAVELGVSRTPVREALQMLQTEGWVEIEAWKGIRVKSISIKDISETFAMRCLIECNALETIVKKATKDEILELDALIRLQMNYNLEYQVLEFAKADKEFHKKLVELTQNKIASRWMEDLSEMVQRFTVALMRSPERHDETIQEHNRIVSALLQKDSSLAIAAMKQHLDRGKKKLIELLKIRESEETV